LFTAWIGVPLVLRHGPEAAAQSQSLEKPHPFVASYRSDDKAPPALLAAYIRFAETARQASDSRKLLSELNRLMLPNAVEITTGRRPEENDREFYGADINVPFLQSHFDPNVISIRKDSDDSWLIRTGTTGLWFVETKSGAWFLYRYIDKPFI
jgi:hypothetical protein